MDSIIKINEDNQPKQQTYGSIQEKVYIMRVDLRNKLKIFRIRPN